MIKISVSLVGDREDNSIAEFPRGQQMHWHTAFLLWKRTVHHMFFKRAAQFNI